MEKINLDELRKTEEYKQYVKTLAGSNGTAVGYDKSHTHSSPYGQTSPAIGNNFFFHQHTTESGLLGTPYEYDPETLKHNHYLITHEENKSKNKSKIKIVKS